MKHRPRGIAIAAVGSAFLTSAALIHQSLIRTLIILLAAPAFLVSTVLRYFIQRFHPISPAWYSPALEHPHMISVCVFFTVTFLWIATVFSPLLFGIRFLGLSHGRSQGLALVGATLVTLLCFYVMLTGFPHP